MAHVLQRPLNPRVAPPRILRGHPHHQSPNLGEHPRPPWAPPEVGPFPGNQFAVPPKNRVGRHERSNLSEYVTSEPLPQNREPPALRIVQPQPPPDPLPLERAILLTKERDHIPLLLLQPSEDCGEEHL